MEAWEGEISVKFLSAFTEEQQRASWLEISQTGISHAWPRTERLCSGWSEKKDNTHHSHSLFTLLPSGKIHRSIHCHTTTLQSSSSHSTFPYFDVIKDTLGHVNQSTHSCIWKVE